MSGIDLPPGAEEVKYQLSKSKTGDKWIAESQFNYPGTWEEVVSYYDEILFKDGYIDPLRTSPGPAPGRSETKSHASGETTGNETAMKTCLYQKRDSKFDLQIINNFEVLKGQLGLETTDDLKDFEASNPELGQYCLLVSEKF